MQELDLNSFLSGLSGQLALYREMEGLNTRIQTMLEAPSDSDPNELLGLVGRKQQLMEQIAGTETELKPHKEQWNKRRAALPDDARAEADALLAELSATIHRLIEMEDEAHRRLEGAMSTTRHGLDTIRNKSRVNRAYAAYGGKAPAARFLDRKDGEE